MVNKLNLLGIIASAILTLNSANGGVVYTKGSEGKEDVGIAELDGTTRKVVSTPNRDLEGIASRDGKNITFITSGGKSFDIYTCDVNGNGIQNLTKNNIYEDGPSFTPDGKRIAFMSKSDNDTSICIMGLSGTPKTIITSEKKIIDYDFSPSGMSIAYSTLDGTDSSIVVVNTESKKKMVIATSGPAPKLTIETGEMAGKKISLQNQVRGVSYSKDGKHIAYVKYNSIGGNELHVVNTMGYDDKVIVETKLPPSSLTWSDDSRIFYAVPELFISIDRNTGEQKMLGSMDIYSTNLEGTVRKISDGIGVHRLPTLSPDGKMIAYLFEENLNGDTSLRVMNIDGSNDREIAKDVFDKTKLSWTK